MLTILSVFLLAASEISQASAPFDYAAAKALADRDEAAMPKLAAQALRDAQAGVLARAADACRSDETPKAFTVVLELDDKGQPVRHWRSVETALARCMEDKLARRVFYVPAKAPLFVSFEVTFTP
jgi:hypothetical protein